MVPRSISQNDFHKREEVGCLATSLHFVKSLD